MKVKFEIDGIIYDGKRYSKGDVVEVCKTMAEKYMHRKLATEYVEEAPEDTVEQIEVYKDRYDCYYVEDNGVYCYCDQDGNEIEENIPEDEILRLISTGSLTKVKMTV